MNSTTPTGPTLPSQDVIEAMNRNAQVVARRAGVAYQASAARRVNRDALRRDSQVRTPVEDVPGTEALPTSTAPTTPNQPIPGLSDLISQFSGSGTTTPNVPGFSGSGGSGGGGGGGGFSSGIGGGGGSGMGGGGGGGGGGSGVVTTTNPDGYNQAPAVNPTVVTPGDGWQRWTGIGDPASLGWEVGTGQYAGYVRRRR